MALNPTMRKRELPFCIKAPVEIAADPGTVNANSKKVVNRYIPKKARNHMIVKNNAILMRVDHDEGWIEELDVMPDVVDVRTYTRSDTDDICVVAVQFADGTTTKATVSIDDVFSLEQGVSVCIAKRLLFSRVGYNCTSMYNKIVRHALKIKEANDRYEIKVAEEQEAADAKVKLLVEKRRLRDERRAAEKREAEIELRKEAYIRAIRVIQEEQKKAEEQKQIEEQKVDEQEKIDDQNVIEGQNE